MGAMVSAETHERVLDSFVKERGRRTPDFVGAGVLEKPAAPLH